MHPKLKLVLLLLLVTVGRAYPQINFPQQAYSQLNRYLLGNIQEKLYIQTNSNQYCPGDTIWFKASLVNAINHKPVGVENLFYVDLISPENKLITHQLFAWENGFSDGSLILDQQLPAGQYKLLAYTNYMRNFDSDFLFQKPISLVSNATDQTKWEFSSIITATTTGDSVRVNMYGQTRNRRELNEPIDVYLQLARGTMFGASCPITNNTGSFSFFVPDSLKLPVALLSVKPEGATTTSEKYRIKLSVQQPDLQFLPEGGNLVPGQENRVAFRCVDADGNPLNVQGVLQKNDVTTITSFATEYEGMGSLTFTPQTGQNYTARISYRDSIFTYALPDLYDEAYSLQLVAQDADSIHFALLKSGDTTSNFLLLGHCRGNTKFMETGALESPRTEISVPTNEFPEGVLTFTLFVNRIPRAERLVYLDKDENIRFRLLKGLTANSAATSGYRIQAFHEDGSPVNGNFSLIGWNSKLEHSLDSLENIHNYLQFSSDLQGEVLSNTDVFNPTDPNRDHKRDLMLMTYGWRRFNWVDIISFGNEQLAYQAEKELYMQGTIYRALTGKPVPENFEISIVLQQKSSVHIDKTVTDADGRFRFTIPAFADSANLTLQTANRRAKPNDYIIDLETNLEQFHINSINFDKVTKIYASPLVSNHPSVPQIEELNNKKAKTIAPDVIAQIHPPRKDNYYHPGKDTIMIEEVEARSNYINKRDSLIDIIGQSDAVIESTQLRQIIEERPWYSNIWDLLDDQIPGLKIEQNLFDPAGFKKGFFVERIKYNLVFSIDPSRAIYFRVLDNPAGYLYIFVDHDLVNDSRIPKYTYLENMDPDEIESIDFIARPKYYDSSLNSSKSTTDIIGNILRENIGEDVDNHLSTDVSTLIFDLTRNLDERIAYPPSFLFIRTKSKAGLIYDRAKGLQSLFLTGITPQREFYVPKYTASNDESANQFRKTVIWQPEIVTDTAGVAEISIPFGVINSNTILQVQGISAQGESGSQTFSFSPTEKPQEIKNAAPALAKTENPSINKTNVFAGLRLYSGVITDAENGNPIPFADLSQASPWYHECTNSAGEFFLSADRLKSNQEIIVSSPGYQPQRLSVPPDRRTVIQVQLAKAGVKQPARETNAENIVRNAIRESSKLYASETTFQGYNRETVAIDGNVYGIYEMAFNSSNAGSAGTPSAIHFETVKFKNMEDKSGHKLMMLKPNHRSLFYPLKADVLATAPEFWRLGTTDQFDYVEIGQVEYDGELCYKIQFHQNDRLVLALQSGILYIGKQTGALRYASWGTSSDKRKYASYTSYLQSNPMEYDVQLADDYYEASYSLHNGQLYLEGTSQQLTILVNGENYLEFNNRLSVVGKTQRNYKDLSSKNPEIITENLKSKHMLVKDAIYQIEPWVNLGIVKPEDKLIQDAEYLHDISLYQ